MIGAHRYWPEFFLIVVYFLLDGYHGAYAFLTNGPMTHPKENDSIKENYPGFKCMRLTVWPCLIQAATLVQPQAYESWIWPGTGIILDLLFMGLIL